MKSILKLVNMPENEFEKKIMQELQGFKLKPSEDVWPKVEERIRKKKKRRGAIIIFLLAGLVLLGYWQWNNFFAGNRNLISNTKPVEEKIIISPGSKSDNKESQLTKPRADKTKRESVIESENNLSANKPEEKKRKSTKLVQGKNISDKNIFNKKQDQRIIEQPENREQDIVQSGVYPLKQQSIKNDSLLETKTNADSLSTKIQESNGHPDSTAVSEKKTGIPDSTNKVLTDKLVVLVDTTKVTSQNKTVSKKWKWGFHFTPGFSSINDGLFSFNMAKSADYTGIPNSGSGAPPSSPAQPSDSKTGFAFQTGVFKQRKISSRSSLSLGIQYAYYRDKINVGGRRDSVINNSGQFSSLRDASVVYNAGTANREYTNRYHFIVLPVNFQWQLNRNTDKPFNWNFGFSLARLVSTNALVYDTSFGGIYYDNKTLLNKTQFDISTGLSWSFLNNKRFQWSIGPVMHIHLNRIAANPFDKNKYLLFTGLRTSVFFQKRK